MRKSIRKIGLVYNFHNFVYMISTYLARSIRWMNSKCINCLRLG